MKNLIIKPTYFVIAIIIFVTGCVSTNVISLKDPSYNNRTFKRILVIANFQKIVDMKEIEKQLVYELNWKGIFAVENFRLLPPIREYTNEEKNNIYNKYNFDSYILISPQGIETTTVYVPDVEKKQYTVTKDSNSVRRESTRTVYQGGEFVVPTQYNTQIKFVDMSNGNVVWQSDTETKINKGTKISEISSSIGRNVANQLQEDGVIK